MQVAVVVSKTVAAETITSSNLQRRGDEGTNPVPRRVTTVPPVAGPDVGCTKDRVAEDAKVKVLWDFE